LYKYLDSKNCLGMVHKIVKMNSNKNLAN